MASSQPIVVGNFNLLRKIGSGSFGDIHLGINITNGEEVAVKLETVTAKHRRLSHESEVYKILSGGFGIPRMMHFGQDREYNFLVMDLLGPSLQDLFNLCSRRFTTKTIIMIADQMIGRVEYMHDKGVLHRDLKPANFVMGTGSMSGRLYVIDFGLAKLYRGPNAQEKDNYRVGTRLFSSINAHLGIGQSRRDDMESLGYLFMYFNRGNLPWQGITAANSKEAWDKILEKKMSTPVEVLCEGFPDEFKTYLKYCRGLRFEEEPAYMDLRLIFRNLLRKINCKYDFSYDWNN